MPDKPDLEEENKDFRSDFEKTLANAMEEEREEARVDRMLVKDRTVMRNLDKREAKLREALNDG